MSSTAAEPILAALPLAYTLGSAGLLLILSKKRIHLDQFQHLVDSGRIDSPDDDPQNSIGGQSESPNDVIQRQIQAKYYAGRSSGSAVSLTRVGLTALQLGLTIFSLILAASTSDGNGFKKGHRDYTGQAPPLTQSFQIIAWSYALALASVFVLRPAFATRFWIRPQLDLFYLVECGLLSWRLFHDSPIFNTPMAEWPFWLKLDNATWLVCLSLIWVSFVTPPYRPPKHPAKLREGEIPREPGSEYDSSICSQLTYSWVNPLVYLGFKRTVNDPDLPFLNIEDQTDFTLKQYRHKSKGTFTRSLWLALRGEVFVQVLWTLPWGILCTISPYCLNKIIKYIECKDCGPPTIYTYGWVVALFVVSLLQSLTFQATLLMGRRMFVHATSICNSEVFAKTLRRKDMATRSKKQSPSGDKVAPEENHMGENSNNKDGSLNISNLVAVDIKKLEDPISYFFQIYGLPFQFVIAAIQLYFIIGNAALVGIAFMILTYPIPAKLFTAIMKLFQEIMNTKDERMDALTEMLGAIRIVKFFGWEAKFVEKITAAREKELQRTKETLIRSILAEVAWMVMPLFNIIVILLAYTKVFGNEITASMLFTTLSLFNIMRDAMNFLPYMVKQLMQAIVSLKRINKFIEEEEELVLDTTVTELDGKAKTSDSGPPVIGFVNASFIWPNKEHEQTDTKVVKKKSWIKRLKAKFSKASEPAENPEPVAEPESIQERFRLKNVSVNFPVNKLSLIVGPTGSGKTALLLALLGELERVEGSLYLPRLDYRANGASDRGSGIAYVAQTAWLQNTSIRNNILFGREFDQARYDAVVEGCALITDFEILEAGDATEIGEQGITLSGGQKQRVSLARAIYSDARVLLLDDCLSAVDTHTGKHLFQTLTGPLLQGRTILMATHQVQLTLNSADFVVVLNKGEVIGSGTPEEMVRRELVENVNLMSPLSDVDSEVSTLDEDQQDKKIKKEDKPKAVSKLTEDEKKAEGSVSIKVYLTYLEASGGWLFWGVLLVLFVIRQSLDVGQNAWLGYWSNKMATVTGAFAIRSFKHLVPEQTAQSLFKAFVPKDSNTYGVVTLALFSENGEPDALNVNYYLGIYILLSVGMMAFATLLDLYAIIGSLRASRILHNQLLYKISRAKVRFFDTTPIGRIINRFSTDITTIDEDVSVNLRWFIHAGVLILGIVAIISANMPWFLVAAAVIVVIYGIIGSLYVPVSRDLKRLNSNSRSPILNHFNESITGLATIRAYGFQKRFLSLNQVNLDDNNRTFLLLWSTNRWLHWRVDIVGAFVAFTTGMLILRNWDRIEPGWAALSLTYALMFTANVIWFIRIYAQNEMNMNAVERISEYLDIEEEPAAIIEGSRPPASWPHAGEIVVDHLTMRYAPGTPDVIKDISFAVKAGEKVGVVGRTGSGKSTLAISLFRFMDPIRGTIKIDGIDIGKIGLQDLRSNLTIIPQDPILFKGTLRSNLDPFGEREDRELWEALRRSHLIPETSLPPSSAPASVRDVEGAASSRSPAASMRGSQLEENETVDPSKITLDTPVKEHGSNFSQGQRQLIALARALVRQSKIIIMDEATASVDFETDQRIQTTIREEMTESTILTIAHRIRTIADFDRVLVMNAGEIVEFDKPLTLMKKEDSLFRSMCERSTEFDTLFAIAEEKERRVNSRG